MGKKNSIFDPARVGTVEGSRDGVDVVVSRDEDGGRHAAIMPRAMGKLGREGILMASDLQHTILEMQKLQNQLEQQIFEARDMGMSWNSIGWCIGISGNAVQQRWGAEKEPDGV
jgi:hypothetical protein